MNGHLLFPASSALPAGAKLSFYEESLLLFVCWLRLVMKNEHTQTRYSVGRWCQTLDFECELLVVDAKQLLYITTQICVSLVIAIIEQSVLAAWLSNGDTGLACVQ